MRHYSITSEFPDLPLQAFQQALGKKRPATLEGGGGKGGGSAPAAPNPYEVANATTQTNQQTAAYNKALNLNNYTNPFGGQQSYVVGTDASGAPIYQTDITSNPALTGQLNSLLGQTAQSGSINQAALGGLYGLNAQTNALAPQYGELNNQLGGLRGALSPEAAQNAQLMGRDAAYASQSQYLDPQFSQGQESLEAKLAAQGLAPGSQAYNNAMLNFQNQKQRAYSDAANQAIMTGSQIGTQNWQNQLAGVQANAALLGQQGQNLGAQSGLIGQQAGLIGQTTGIGQMPYGNLQSVAGLIPGYSGPSTSSVNPADIGSYINNQYMGQLGQYNAGQTSRNQMTSGIMGLAGTLGSAYLMSDRRLKRDISVVGEWNGTPVYSYRYLFDSKRHLGVMAQEAPAHAVTNVCGVLMVDYRSL